jgi:hypothetical protein
VAKWSEQYGSESQDAAPPGNLESPGHLRLKLSAASGNYDVQEFSGNMDNLSDSFAFEMGQNLFVCKSGSPNLFLGSNCSYRYLAARSKTPDSTASLRTGAQDGFFFASKEEILLTSSIIAAIAVLKWKRSSTSSVTFLMVL